MSALPSTGSPELRGRASVPFAIHDEINDKKTLAGTTRQESSVSHTPPSFTLDDLVLTVNPGIKAQH